MAEKLVGYMLDEELSLVVHLADTKDDLRQMGCLPLEETDKPTDGKKYRAVYEEIDGVIRQSWEVCEL